MSGWDSEKAMTPKRKPRLAVFKFASCDGCQLSLLDCEDELLAVLYGNFESVLGNIL